MSDSLGPKFGVLFPNCVIWWRSFLTWLNLCLCTLVITHNILKSPEDKAASVEVAAVVKYWKALTFSPGLHFPPNQKIIWTDSKHLAVGHRCLTWSLADQRRHSVRSLTVWYFAMAFRKPILIGGDGDLPNVKIVALMSKLQISGDVFTSDGLDLITFSA